MRELKVTCFVGERTMDGELRNIRKWDDIGEEEKEDISKRLQLQCAEALGYEIKIRL